MSKLDISKLSNENIADKFAEAFEEQVASLNKISEFECNCIRESASSDEAKIEVTITGMAGDPISDDFKDGNLKNYDTVVVKDDEKGNLKFVYSSDETINLNTSDYMVVYKVV